MEKYKICPYCGKHNPPNLLDCIECESDLSNVIVTDESMEQVRLDKANTSSLNAGMIRICDCGEHNPVSARKCRKCGEDISDILPVSEVNINSCPVKFILSSFDGAYAFELKDPYIMIGREAEMKEYLSLKPYVSRKHAELFIEDGKLYINNLSQTNYTFVNNIKIVEKIELFDGDEIGLGGIIQNGERQKDAAYFLVRIGQCT